MSEKRKRGRPRKEPMMQYTLRLPIDVARKLNNEVFFTSERKKGMPTVEVIRNIVTVYLEQRYTAFSPYPAQFAEFDAILAEMSALHRRKAADYGADSIADTGLYGVLIRMTDKLHRARRLTNPWADGAAVNDETIEDTLQDLASYAVIAVVLLRGKWGK